MLGIHRVAPLMIIYTNKRQLILKSLEISLEFMDH